MKPLSAENLDDFEMKQQQRRASMSGRRVSLVDAIPDFPSLKKVEKELEVLQRSFQQLSSWPSSFLSLKS